MIYIVDILIWLMGILLAIASLAAVTTKALSLRKNKTPMVVNGIPAKAITWCTIAFTIIVLALAYLLMPANEMMVNGLLYTDTTWLRVSNMCVVGCLALLLAAVVSIAFGIYQNRRSGSKQDIPSMFIRKKVRKA